MVRILRSVQYWKEELPKCEDMIGHFQLCQSETHRGSIMLRLSLMNV